MLEQSHLVKKLSQNEIQDLISERDLLNDLWEPHSLPTALRHGKTIYLQQIDEAEIIKLNLKLSLSRLDKCPKTKIILQKIAGNGLISRCYWHKLMPGDKIERHNDRDLIFVMNGVLAHRYQIYLDSDPRFVLELDGKIVPTKPWENTVIDFALEKMHFYHNTSDKPWTFLVFDVLHNNLSPNI